MFRVVLDALATSRLIHHALATPSAVACLTASAWAGGTALQFDGATVSVSMGIAPPLNLAQFTLEAWFRDDGDGHAVITSWPFPGAYPILAKGRGWSDTQPQYDLNYFIGIRADTRVLVAEFENRDTFVSGWNHPVVGTTVIEPNVWYHVAASYDGVEWRLYLNGTLEMHVVHDVAPQFESAEHFALGTVFENGFANGRFKGALDEVRVWNVVRTAEEIRANVNETITAAPGLVGRWGLDDGDGQIAADSSGSALHGVIVGFAEWVAGAPFDADRAPSTSGPACPPDDTISFSSTQTLSVAVSDLDGDLLDVRFLGRPRKQREHTYTIVAIPDTQHYVRPAWWPEHFFAITQWVVDNHETANIPYVGHVGDIVHNAANLPEWIIADEAISVLDDAPQVAYGLTVGNHDEEPFGNPDGTQHFNHFFPFKRYEGVVPWYGGHHGKDNDNHFVLFDAEGDGFIAVHLEFRNPAPSIDVLEWVDELLAVHADRRAIIVLHETILPGGAGEQAAWDDQGEAVYNRLRQHPNLLFILAGHRFGEGRRLETFEGNTAHILMHNFQLRPEGGEAFVRLYEFAPGDEEIIVRTYSPALDAYETDPDSAFSLGTDTPGGPWAPIDAVANVPSGGVASVVWSGLERGRTYEWRVEISDATSTTTGATWTLTIPACFADVDDGDSVGLADLLALLASWGSCAGPCVLVPPDLDGDGMVGVTDLLGLLSAWGPCP